MPGCSIECVYIKNLIQWIKIHQEDNELLILKVKEKGIKNYKYVYFSLSQKEQQLI